MRTSNLRLAAILVLLSTAPATIGQSVYTINVVGYYNRTLGPGDNLVANQLGAGTRGQYTNALNTILVNGVADGSTLTLWDPQANAFLPLSTYSAAQTNWSINYSLNLGDGALLHSPVGATNTFVGEVDGSIFNIDTLALTWTPNYAPGLYLLSCPVPISGATFDYVVGRSPREGEWVDILNESLQIYSRTTYHDGLGWDNGDPTLEVGQAAWFDLGPVTVPEPSSGVLLAAAGGVALVLRRRRS